MNTLDQARLACSPMGELEYVVESTRHGRIEKWFVLRPHPDVASAVPVDGIALPNGCRIVVEANSLQTVGILAADLPAC